VRALIGSAGSDDNVGAGLEASPEAMSDTVEQGDSIARNVAFSFAAQMVGAAATAALTLYLVRALGPSEFGAFAIALGLGGLVLLPGDFGVSGSASRFIAEHRGEWPVIGGLLRDAMRLKLVLTGPLAIAMFVLAQPIADAYSAPALTWTLRGMAIAIFAQSYFMLFTATFMALGRVSLNLKLVTAESVPEAVSAATLVILGTGAAGAAFGRAIGYCVAAGLGIALTIKLIGRANLGHGRGPVGGSRRIFRYAGALLIIDGAYALLAPIGTLLLGAFLNAKAVGVYSAPVRFITFLHYPGFSIAAGVAPRLARGRNTKPDVPALVSGLRWIILIQTVLVAPTIVWARPMADILLGAGYARSADVLAVLAPFTFLSGFAPLLSLSVNYLGEARRRVPIAVVTLLLSVGLDVWLIQDIGLLGSAISSDIAYAFYVLGHLWICKRLLDLPLRPVARDLARALLAAAAMSGVMAAFGTNDLSALAIVAGGVAGIAVYVGVLLLTRAVTVDELRDAGHTVARKFGRGRRILSTPDQGGPVVGEESRGGVTVEESVPVAQGHEEPAVEGHGAERGP
jgi:O-antigen/teichoic acid export membrane protein